MSLYNVLAIILTLAIGFTYVNQRWFKMPITIGIMCASLVLSLCIITIGKLGFNNFGDPLFVLLSTIDFHDIVINGMLGYLLFAAALTVDIRHLREKKWEVSILAIAGTVVSTFLIAAICHTVMPILGITLPWIYCLLFGALISPTDPIAVLGMFKDLNAPRHMVIILEGESLVNDGVGIVIFLTIYAVAFAGAVPTLQGISLLFLQQAIGGVLFGIVVGMIGFWLIKPLHNARLAILVTIALVAGGYALAQILNLSGALAMVVAGILLGNLGRQFYQSPEIEKELMIFWEVIDEVLNAVLFLLVGLEVLIMPWSYSVIFIGMLAIPLVLLVRYLIIVTPMAIFCRYKKYFPYVITILTWGGLRGGLALALALTLPRSEFRDIVLIMTYIVVLFSILVQGLTMKPLISKSLQRLEER